MSSLIHPESSIEVDRYSNPKSNPWVTIVVLMRLSPNTPYIDLFSHLGLL